MHGVRCRYVNSSSGFHPPGTTLAKDPNWLPLPAFRLKDSKDWRIEFYSTVEKTPAPSRIYTYQLMVGSNDSMTLMLALDVLSVPR